MSALLNVLLLAGIPLLGYYLYHRLRHGRRFAEVARRAGLQVGKPIYLLYSVLLAVLVVGALMVWPPSLELQARESSAMGAFVGMEWGATAVLAALLYGVVKTGFAEEFLFRGLIAGSLGRRLSLPWANLLQALVFLAPHLLLLKVMPEAWPILVVVFVGALATGWIRIKSGSMFGPWLIHATANVTTALSLVARSSA
jgi:membrane protease YdiL (CAAX protease family)